MVGETIPLDLMPASKGRVGITRRFPIGPIAGISPFNFPLNLAAHKVVARDRERQPDRPQAAVQGPAGDADGGRDHRGGRRAGRVGERPADEPRARRPDGLATTGSSSCRFTGSPSVGWRMKERAGKKRVVLELGGNAGVIVDKTADLDWAVRRTLVGAFSYAGQVCISVQRMFVHEDVWDAFMAKFIEGREGAQARRSARPADRRRADGRRARRVADPALGRRGAGAPAAPRSSAARPTAPSSRRRSSPTSRRPPRSARTRRSRRWSSRSSSAISRTRSRQVNDSFFGLQTGDLHERPRPRLAGVPRARGRRRDRQRRADLPDRPHALRRRQGLRARSRGSPLGDRGHDRGPDHGARLADVAHPVAASPRSRADAAGRPIPSSTALQRRLDA